MYLGLDICIPGYGLCNQLYGLCGTMTYCERNNIPIIFVGMFNKDIEKNEYCKISEILDLEEINKISKVKLVDINNFKVEILSIKLGKEIFSLEIKEDLIDNGYLKPNKLIIDRNFNFDNLKSKPISYFKKMFSQNYSKELGINVNFKIDGILYSVKYKLDNFTLETDIDINFSNIILNKPLQYNDSSALFYSYLSLLKFQESLIIPIKSFITTIDFSKTVNCIHLRLEDDALLAHCVQNNMDFKRYKTIVEEKYISLIKRYINKGDLTILLAYNYDNRVIDFLKENNYNYITTPKISSYREICAINDLVIGEMITGTYIYLFESSYSYTLLHRLKNRNTVKNVMFELNNIEGNERTNNFNYQ